MIFRVEFMFMGSVRPWEGTLFPLSGDPVSPYVFWHVAEVYISGGQRHQKWSTCSLCVLCGRRRGLAGGLFQLAGSVATMSCCYMPPQMSPGREHICAQHGPKRLTGLSSFKIALGCLLLWLVWMRWDGTRETQEVQFEGMWLVTDSPGLWSSAGSFWRRWPQSHESTVSSSWLWETCWKSFLLHPNWLLVQSAFPHRCASS